jgi:hypothetical protein
MGAEALVAILQLQKFAKDDFVLTLKIKKTLSNYHSEASTEFVGALLGAGN